MNISLLSLAIEIIGWAGSVMVLLAYGMNMAGKMKADSILYILLNLFGSICLIINTGYHHAIPSMMVNVLWVLFAIISFISNNKKIKKA